MDATDLPPGRSPGWASPDPDHPAAGAAPAGAGWPAILSLARSRPPTPDFADLPTDARPGPSGDRGPGAGSGWTDRWREQDRPPSRALTVGAGPVAGPGPVPSRGLLTDARPAADPAPGVGRAAAGGLAPVGGGGVPRTAGGVATWLPEGRWADTAEPAAVLDPPARPARPAPDRVGEERRRRGQRRVAATRIAARLAGWPRRALAVLLLLAAVALALRPEPPSSAVAPAPPGVPVVVAGRDLPAGAVLARADLRTTDLPTAAVPAGVARDPAGLLGRTVAGPVRRGEVLTDARVVGPGLTAGLGPGTLAAVPVRLADSQSAALVRAGDRIDVLGAPVEADAATGSRDAVDVATGVRVLAVLRSNEDSDGVVIVVAADPAVARRLAGAASRHRLTVAVRPP